MNKIGNHSWKRKTFVPMEDTEMDIPDGDLHTG
jgi:hypothetical protein